MAIKNAEYQIKESGGFNVYHYTTNSGAVKILDSTTLPSKENSWRVPKIFLFESKILTAPELVV